MIVRLDLENQSEGMLFQDLRDRFKSFQLIYTMIITICIISSYKVNWKLQEAYDNLLDAMEDQ